MQNLFVQILVFTNTAVFSFLGLLLSLLPTKETSEDTAFSLKNLNKSFLKSRLSALEEKIKNSLTDSKTLHSILVLVFWTMASRFLGLLRTLFTARMQTVDTEMFNASFLVADTITTALILGSLSTAIMPNMSKYITQKKTELLNFYTTFCLVFGFLGISLIALLSFWQMPWILNNFVNANTISELSELGRLDEFILTSRIILISPVLFSIKTVLGAFLNSKKEFFIYSLDGTVSNLGNILGLSVLYAMFGPTGAICGTVLGVLIAVGLFFWDARRFGFEFGFGQLASFFKNFSEFWQILKADIFKGLGVYFARLAVFSQVRMAEVLIIIFSSGISSGQITALRVGMDIQGVFFGVILSIATVFLPNITNLLHQTQNTDSDTEPKKQNFGSAAYTLQELESNQSKEQKNIDTEFEQRDLQPPNYPQINYPQINSQTNSQSQSQIQTQIQLQTTQSTYNQEIPQHSVNETDPRSETQRIYNQEFDLKNSIEKSDLIKISETEPSTSPILKEDQGSSESNYPGHQDFWNQFWKYLRIVTYFSLFGTFVTILGTPILLWVIKTFAFLPSDSFLSSPQNLNLTLSFTIISSVLLVFQSLAEIFNRYFIATQKIIPPLIASLGGNLLAFEITFLFSPSWGSSWSVIWGFVFSSFLLAFLSGYFVYEDWIKFKKSKI